MIEKIKKQLDDNGFEENKNYVIQEDDSIVVWPNENEHWLVFLDDDGIAKIKDMDSIGVYELEEYFDEFLKSEKSEESIVSIDSPRNYINFNDFPTKQSFIVSLNDWYKENNWSLPNGEDFGEYWDEKK